MYQNVYMRAYVDLFMVQTLRIKLDLDVSMFACVLRYAIDAHKWIEYNNNFEAIH